MSTVSDLFYAALSDYHRAILLPPPDFAFTLAKLNSPQRQYEVSDDSRFLPAIETLKKSTPLFTGHYSVYAQDFQTLFSQLEKQSISDDKRMVIQEFLNALPEAPETNNNPAYNYSDIWLRSGDVLLAHLVNEKQFDRNIIIDVKDGINKTHSRR